MNHEKTLNYRNCKECEKLLPSEKFGGRLSDTCLKCLRLKVKEKKAEAYLKFKEKKKLLRVETPEGTQYL